MTVRRLLLAALGGGLAAAGCSSNPSGPPYDPALPTAWAAAVTNQYFPLTPGTILEYTAQTSQGTETITVETLAQTRVVNGVTAAIVHDQVFLNGELIEDTFDWYAQDADGNVWYVGEDSKEIMNGQVVSTAGSWEWGVDGALPGIYMWADPGAHLGEAYRQEFYRNQAEDWGKVVAVGVSVTVPFGTFANCIQTEDWNGLESGSREDKYYCPQVGPTLEVGRRSGNRVELTGRTP